MQQVRRIPWISVGLLASNLKCLLTRPASYFSALFKTLWENKTSLNFFVRAALLFPRAVFMSAKMQEEGVSHIHAHYSTHPALVAWIIHKLTGISYSVTVHAHDIFVRRSMLATKMQEARFVIAISEFNKDFLIKQLGTWIGDKTYVVHCGIDPKMYELRNGSSRQDRTFNLISVGGLRVYKGMSYLVEASAILQERGVPVRCRIVGEGEERSKLESLIQAKKVENVVELVGPKTQFEVAEMLADSDCYVQPSIIDPNGKMEGIPVALMEALASELPVIASDLSGIPELVIPGKTGYLVPQANVQALADAIENVYRNPSEAREHSRIGREYVFNEFNLHTNTNRLSSLFKQYTLIADHDYRQ